MWIAAVLVAFVIIATLAFYAGKLLYLLHKQNVRQKNARQKRIGNIVESINTIGKAMSQQQCELSEGAIRICNLLDALPLDPKPDFQQKFPHIFSLFQAISGFATLDARRALSKKEVRQQDKARQQIESEHESRVLDEINAIHHFCNSLA